MEEEGGGEEEALGEDTEGDGRTSGFSGGDDGDGDKKAEMDEELGASYATALLAAAESGEAPGLLGEYLRGSPQVNDLLALWDLDARKVSGGIRFGRMVDCGEASPAAVRLSVSNASVRVSSAIALRRKAYLVQSTWCQVYCSAYIGMLLLQCLLTCRMYVVVLTEIRTLTFLARTQKHVLFRSPWNQNKHR